MTLKGKIKDYFSGLWTLVVMQLKDKLDFSFAADKKKTLTKLTLRLVLFVIVIVAINIVIGLLNQLSVFSIITPNFPIPFLNMIFIIMMLLSIITCIVSLTKSLYFSKDNLVLLSYPVKSNTVFLSKLIVFYIISLIREAGFMLPLFIAYGITLGYGVLYFVWVIIMYFLICAVPVAIASVISIPWMFISMFFRKRPLLQDITIVVILFVTAIFVLMGINAIPEDMHFLTLWNRKYLLLLFKFAFKLQEIFYPLFLISATVLGCDLTTIHGASAGSFNASTLPNFGIILGAVILLTLISYLFAKPLFFKMAAKPFEFNKRVIKQDHLMNKNHKKPSFFSLMWKDVLVDTRTPGTVVSNFVMIIICPLAIALMNKLFKSINTSFMGDQFVVMFNMLIMVMIPLVSNVSFGSVYSREGESSYLLKASPSNYVRTLTAKLVVRWFLMTVSILLTVISYSHYCNLFFNRPVFLFLSILFVYTGHLIWSAELDFMNPQDQLYKEIGEGNISNPNENLSGIFAFLISFIVAFMCFLLTGENSIFMFVKLAAISALFLFTRVILAITKIKGYSTSRSERGMK